MGRSSVYPKMPSCYYAGPPRAGLSVAQSLGHGTRLPASKPMAHTHTAPAAKLQAAFIKAMTQCHAASPSTHAIFTKFHESVGWQREMIDNFISVSIISFLEKLLQENALGLLRN